MQWKWKVSTCWQSRSRSEGPAVNKAALLIVFEKIEHLDNGQSPKTLTAQSKFKRSYWNYKLVKLLTYDSLYEMGNNQQAITIVMKKAKLNSSNVEPRHGTSILDGTDSASEVWK